MYSGIDPTGILRDIPRTEGGTDEIDGPATVLPSPYLWPNSGHNIKFGTASGFCFRVTNKQLKKGILCVDVNGPSTGSESNKALFKLYHDRYFPTDTERNEEQSRDPADVLNVLMGVPGVRVSEEYSGKVFLLRTWQDETTGRKTLVAEEFEEGSITELLQQIADKGEDPLKYRFQIEYRGRQEGFYLHDYDVWNFENKIHYHYVFWHKDGSVSRRKKLPHQVEPNPNLRFLMKNYHDLLDITDFA